MRAFLFASALLVSSRGNAHPQASWLKFYTTPTREVMGAAIDQAHKRGIIAGRGQVFGSITPEKLADLVVINGDPVKHPVSIRNVVTVCKDGLGHDSRKLIESVRGLVGIR